MKLIWMVIALWTVIGLDPGLALAGCQTWTVMDGGRTRICTQCCYGSNCTLTCY